jgi:diacylglycerol kinase family enzyme
VHLAQGKEIEIITRKAKAVTADGELVTLTPARFEMLAGAVAVFVPASYLEEKQELTHATQKPATTGA